MTKVLKLSLIAASIAIVIKVTYCLYGIFYFHTLPVSIHIKNLSGETPQNLKLHFESQISGNLIAPPPQNGKSINVKYFPMGEGNFTVDVGFDSGRKLHFNAGYIENGDELDIHIKKNEITSPQLPQYLNKKKSS